MTAGDVAGTPATVQTDDQARTDLEVIGHLDFDPDTRCESRDLPPGVIAGKHPLIKRELFKVAPRCLERARYLILVHACHCGRPEREALVCETHWQRLGSEGFICPRCFWGSPRDTTVTVVGDFGSTS